MKQLTSKEAKQYYGGGGISAAFISALTRGFNIFTDLGRYLGSSIRKIFTHDLCR